MTLLKDLIEIPERVGRGDYVFTLEDAVKSPDRVLGNYVVTDQLRGRFDQALAFVRGAMQAGESRATYLHGSFGSGKSHFMAVLYLLLAHVRAAREETDLQPIIAAHDEWLQGRRFLLVPVHMINSGAKTMEQAILGGYVRHVRTLHPDAPTPPVYVSHGIVENAVDLRREMGDERFFAALNRGAEEEIAGLGELSAPSWDATTFDRAIAAGPGDYDYDWLVSTIVDTLLRGYSNVVRGDAGAFVSLAEGLGVISRHAKSLGYDGLVLFLDELILWLATQIQNTAFVQEEGRKIASLREAPVAERPLPIASFVARQRDLRQLVGDHVPGAEHLAFEDTLGWWEGRFDTITLEDRNLRAIAARRVLAPRPDVPDAAAQLDAAFQATVRTRDDVVRILLGPDAGIEDFRAVYPFSPAFIDVLVAASSVLQRERTAIRVMVQLLSERRGELKVGDLVPVGDLFDVLASGDQPFSEEMKREFDTAKRLYETTLRPQLRGIHRLVPSDAETPALQADDRLIKTLLLAALIPDAEPLRGLTVSRLVALNHGTITSPIPGQERAMALSRLRQLARNVGELRIEGDQQDPTVRLVLSGVDTDSILQRARGELDTQGARRAYVRGVVFDAIGVADDDTLYHEYAWTWRGTDRRVEVLYGNVRELPADRVLASVETWKVVIDFPFDVEGMGARDDIARIEQLRDEIGGSRTVFWTPAFFTRAVVEDLGLLVTIDGVLKGDRLAKYAPHLSQVDQGQARAILDSRRSQLREGLRQAIEQAYGVATARAEVVDDPDGERFHALEPTLLVRPPVGATLGEAFEGLLDQLLRHQFPAHPMFGERLTRTVANRVWEIVSRAVEQEGGRLEVEQPRRATMRNIAAPLKLGEMHEGPFVLGRHWTDHFTRLAARDRVQEPTVGQLRAWIDEPEPMGLPAEAVALVVLTYAVRENLSLRRHGAHYPASLTDLPDDLALVSIPLPDQREWDRAAARAGALLGVTVPPLVSASNLTRSGRAVREAAAARRAVARELVQRLEGTVTPALELARTNARLATAREAANLLDQLHDCDDDEALARLAALQLERGQEVVGRSIARAADISRAISTARWELIGTAKRMAADGDARARAIIEPLASAAAADEFAERLDDAVASAEQAATALLAERAVAIRVGAETGGASEDQGATSGDEGQRVTVHRGLSVSAARAALDALDDAREVRVDLTIHQP